MKSIIRLVLVLLVLAIVAGGGYVLTHGEQPPAPVMVHHELSSPSSQTGSAQNGSASAGSAHNAGISLPELPPVGGH